MTNVAMTENIIEDKPNAVIYLRVSSKKQFDEGYSIASQKSSCENYARLKKFNVSKVFKILRIIPRNDPRTLHRPSRINPKVFDSFNVFDFY